MLHPCFDRRLTATLERADASLALARQIQRSLTDLEARSWLWLS